MEIFTPERLEPFFANGLKDFSSFGIYMMSMQTSRGALAFAVNLGDSDAIVADSSVGFIGESFTACGRTWTLAPQTHENAVILRKVFPFTAPSAVLKENRTAAVYDSHCTEASAHIRLFREYDAFPVYVWQSGSGQETEAFSDAVSFAVFREGFTRPFGVAAEGLQTAEQVEYALSCGCTAISLDCGKCAFELAESVYKICFEGRGNAELELLVNIADTEQHLELAQELEGRGVKIAALALSFCGKKEEAEKQLPIHFDIAKRFGYKLSFSALADSSFNATVGRATKGHFHIKLNGSENMPFERSSRGEYATALYGNIASSLKPFYDGFYSFIFPNMKKIKPD